MAIRGKLSKRYYRTFGGGCRRIAMEGRQVIEYPYRLRLALPCNLPGRHPHKPANEGTKLSAVKR